MRHTLFTMLAVCSLSGAYAQKNSILLFGNSTGNHNKISDSNLTNTNSAVWVNAGVGYQLSDHITVGLEAKYHISKSENLYNLPLQSMASTTQDINFGVFGRYTQYLGERFFVYLQADAGYGKSYAKAEMVGNPYTSRTSASGPFAADLTPAIGCFIYKGWAANLNIGSVSYRYSNIEGVKRSSVGYSIGQGVVVGVSKNFIRKAKVQPQG